VKRWVKCIMTQHHGQEERRRSYRVSVGGTGHLWRDGHVVGAYSLHDLSSGGCLLKHGPPCEPGHVYRAVLQVGQGRPLRQSACVVHQALDDSGQWLLGVAFVDTSPDIQERLEQLLLHDACCHAAQARTGRVLVAHSDAERRASLCELLARLGYEAAAVSTFSDAIWELENGPMDFHTALVSHALADSDGETVLKYIGSNYPGVRRVLISNVIRLRHQPSPRSVDLVVPDTLEHELLEALSGDLATTRGDNKRPDA
jgi:hypothetical protein